MRAVFFDEDVARLVVARLVADGFEATASREPFAGEDDDEDHPWAVTTDAPALLLELLVDAHDGWLDDDGAARAARRTARAAARPAPPAPR